MQRIPKHSHPEHPDTQSRSKNIKKLSIALGVCVSVFLVEIVGAWISGSLALLADAFHMLTDAIALIIALTASALARRKKKKTVTYGYYRLEVLAAFVNGILLSLMAIYIFYEAVHRLFDPPEINAFVMLSVGSLGLIANLIMVLILHSSDRQNLNMQGAFFHVLGDTFASVTVIIGALGIYFFQAYWPDALVSLFVSGIILFLGVHLLKSSGHILLEGTPRGVSAERVIENLIQEFPEIEEIHDFHYWQITSRLFAMTAHIKIAKKNRTEDSRLIDRLNAYIRKEYGIAHTTFQIEFED